MNSTIPEEINKVVSVMQKTGKYLVRCRNNKKFGAITYKQGKEVVSKIDVKVERKVRKKIKDIFPNHKIWGEELGKHSGDLDKENFIIIDALDGTKNYLSGIPLFATQIACLEQGEIKWGIIVLPVLKETFVAVKGIGSYLNGERITGSTQSDFSLSNQCFGLGHAAETLMKLLSVIKDGLAEPRTYGSAGVHFAFTACGRIDIYIAIEAAFYDMAPGILLCQEAGLETTDLKGNKFEHKGGTNTGIVVANHSLIEGYKKIVGDQEL